MSGRAARSWPLAACVLLMLTQSGCALRHHGKERCHEPAIGGDSKDLPPLKVPAGLDAPDTRNAIKVPPLSEPEVPHLPSDPCLSQPPSFKS